MNQVCKLTKGLALGLVLLVATACASYGTVPAPTATSGGTVPAPTATTVGVVAPTATRAPATSPTQVAAAAVDIRGFAFSPATITVAKGTTVTWTNNDSVAHTVTATDPAGAFDSGNMRTGATFTFTFNTTGTFRYRCGIHPSMVGTVEVK